MERLVEINGQLVPFSVMKDGDIITEYKEINLIGYSKIYYIDGKKHESSKLIKFYS